MADKEIKIGFPEEKMEALSFFLQENNETVEAVLKAHLDKSYEKVVPQQVRKFVESRMAGQTAGQTEDQETVQSGSRENSQRTTRLQNRRAARQSAARETAPSQENEVPAVRETHSPGREQEPENDMAMGM